jgi:hypothetical protein
MDRCAALTRLWTAWGTLPAVVYPVAALARSQNGSGGAHAVRARGRRAVGEHRGRANWRGSPTRRSS